MHLSFLIFTNDLLTWRCPLPPLSVAHTAKQVSEISINHEGFVKENHIVCVFFIMSKWFNNSSLQKYISRWNMRGFR